MNQIKEPFLVHVNCLFSQDLFFNLVKYGKLKASSLTPYSD